MRRPLALALASLSCVGTMSGRSPALIDAGVHLELDAGVPDAAIDPGAPDGAAEPRDAGPPDAGAPPAPAGDAGFFGDSRCDAGTFRICDGFENDSLDLTIWGDPGPPRSDGFATIDTTRAARGRHALHLRSNVQVRPKEKWPFLANGIFLRAFMLWGQPMPDWHLTYFWVASSDGAFTLGSYHGQLGINEFGPNNGDTGVDARDPLPVGVWACVEWQIDPHSDEVHVWVDESEVPADPQNPFGVPTMHVTNWPPMSWDNFTIELITSNPMDDLWIDELALADTRIGCRR